MYNFLFVIALLVFQQGVWNENRHGVVIDGYDLVSYFSEGPLEGDKRFSYEYQGTIFYFSSDQNLNLFKKDEKKYLPQYGGFCAYAMGSTGEKVEVNPLTFKIVGGKLYLFYNSWGNNTLVSWNEDEGKLKLQADKNWKEIYFSNY